MNIRRSMISGRLVAASVLVFGAWCLGMTKQMPAGDWFSRFMQIQGTTVTMHLMLILSCFSGGTGFCEDYERGFYRQIIQKKGMRAYALGQMGAAASMAFLSCLIGCMLYVFLLMGMMSSPNKEALQAISEAVCFGNWTIGHYQMVAFIQCLLNAVLSALVCCAAMAVSAWIPKKFTTLCMPMILFWLELTIAVYILKLPNVFDWDGVFLLLVGSSSTVMVFFGKVLFNIVLWTIIPAALFLYKVKERYRNE
jgi:hypothetical protein